MYKFIIKCCKVFYYNFPVIVAMSPSKETVVRGDAIGRTARCAHLTTFFNDNCLLLLLCLVLLVVRVTLAQVLLLFFATATFLSFAGGRRVQ